MALSVVSYRAPLRLALVSLGLSASSMALAAPQAPAPATDAPAADIGTSGDAIIVTGTRESGRLARQSATPIDVVKADTLTATGQSNLVDSLRSVLPSFNAPAVGYDVGALARTFALRGLSPSQTLILVNGKRRHLSSSIYADSDPSQGSNVVDLDMIPLAAVGRVEVLRDGAAAQYGSDAIAGVINVILKDDANSGGVSVQGGKYYAGDGTSIQANADKGVALKDGGVLHLSAGYRYQDFTNRSGDSGGVQPAKVQGMPRSVVVSGGYDYTRPLGETLDFYSFGTYAWRKARANENPRQPGWFSDAVDALYPQGFTPQETLNEHDFSVTGGIKSHGDWAVDLSSTYGRDTVKLRNISTINPDLLADTGNAQTDFNVGGFAASEWTSNLDVKHQFDLGLAGPATFAFGAENRYETYEIRAGEPTSYYSGGPQAFPGFRPSDAANVHRNSVAGYADLTLRPVKAWELSGALRWEHYNGVGSRLNGKLASRYDVTDRFALRGSVSTGFHAPTLAQQNYSATTVTTGYASIQLPLGSPGANLLGAPALKPETSTSASLGFVAEPVHGLSITVDAYRIDVKNRIIESAYLYGDLAQAAIAANGTTIPAGLDPGNVSAVFFTNGVDTRTQGVDMTASWMMPAGALGRIRWDAGLAYVDTTIRRVHAAPAVLANAGLSLVDAVQRTNLTTATPSWKASLAAAWSSGPLDLTLRNTFYSNARQAQGYAEPYYIIDTGARVITDLDIGYRVTPQVRVGVGANNLFDVHPRMIPTAIGQALNYDRYSHVAPYGINGGSYYLRLTVNL
ncbi:MULTISPECIES: TonB-dependent receptor [unclassified Novosphingobium]|uniref:TonB-dependent receptor plug domain-containing protein n=1 Tax=unclassified Novosphingobium TaxID=2644732 RepID=UPI0017ED6A32|nr:iron complex outermembrane receptor protein [Novosphingobium sp. BK256]MBB3375752.1 iron complex outermembrane receptor protein [Novosphingobium sp. BK280]MBB3380165.1 iron complex outermembrane receptor protein [Novosphingobium sp. BK258]MBB3421859.1 iron complex outermembrane receptor protein [Novosphingobium sp. BK267]MBB3450515.1 iron complex outermembrane receptor protein [Novosphingobium sp. BK352]MBB3479026.1 iron complex outermembrane receptor protein [Novosphingobium sp. BK369]MBB